MTLNNNPKLPHMNMFFKQYVFLMIVLHRYIFAAQIADGHGCERFKSDHAQILTGCHWMYPARPVKACEASVLNLVLPVYNFMTGFGQEKPTLFMDNWFSTIRLFA